MMPERSVDGKESINLHDEDVNATIGEGEKPKELIHTEACSRIFTNICFLDNNRYDAVAEKKRDVSVVDVSCVGQVDVDEDAEEHHGHHHPGLDQAYLHVRDIYVAG